MKGWIDFRALRTQLRFEELMQKYGIEIKRKGEQHLGFCPLPKHQGKKNSPSFSVQLSRGIFQCFGCGAKGNVLDFACLMENVDLSDGPAVRKLAIELQERFCRTAGTSTEIVPKLGRECIQATLPTTNSALVNPPLDFTLKGLNPGHPYLTKRGFTTATIEHFGLGYCSRGLLKERIAIPLEDELGRLVGYAGRVVDDSAVSENNPRYRLPGDRKRGEITVEFRKAQLLYNSFRILGVVNHLVVVEGFTAVWWLHQNGFPNVVATMGSDCSEKQAELITSRVEPNGRVTVIPDGDAAGERFAECVLRRVSPHRFVRWGKLEVDQQPTDCTRKQLQALLGI